MEADEYLVHGSLPLNYQAEPRLRGVIAALTNLLMKAWVGLYAPPPHRVLPVL